MEPFIPVIFLIVILLFTLSNAKKGAQKNAQKGKGQTARHENQAQAQPAPEQPSPEGPGETLSTWERMLAPTVHFPDRDNSVYQGSLNAITDEGEDPCHEEQLSSPTMREETAPETNSPAAAPAAGTAPGLSLRWTGDEVVRGFVMSEILKRKTC